ncbi:GNAT family N-acetyltransferase [Streptomyces sp. C36]|uniref:GNAT family N-acetyltransferase n=1 Tax=Streptomyces sp. C36 TaxID=3237122 RepID=UPI0034C67F1B
MWLRSFDAVLPSVRRAHDDAEIRNWFSRMLMPQYETWVAVAENRVVGVLVLNGRELKQLYLDPPWRGRGLGDRFMSLTKQHPPDGLALWTFQVNKSAQRFYERHGFIAVERTDGLRNEERELDVRYVWQPRRDSRFGRLAVAPRACVGRSHGFHGCSFSQVSALHSGLRSIPGQGQAGGVALSAGGLRAVVKATSGGVGLWKT